MYLGTVAVPVGFLLYTGPLKLIPIADSSNGNTTTPSLDFSSRPISYYLEKEPGNETSKRDFEERIANSTVEGLVIVNNGNGFEGRIENSTVGDLEIVNNGTGFEGRIENSTVEGLEIVNNGNGFEGRIENSTVGGLEIVNNDNDFEGRIENSTVEGLEIVNNGNEFVQSGDCDWDDSHPLCESRNCPFVDGGFRCQENGRADSDYMKWRWQPSHCDLPRFNADDFLERIRNSRVVFVGDSIGRNQWESLICMLAEAIPNKSRIYEVNGNPIIKHKGFLSFRFVEYYRAPFLVFQGRPPRGAPPEVRTTLKVDTLDYTSHLWSNGDVLIFNTGHWWNYGKTIRGGCYFQEGETVDMKMDVETALRRAMKTWGQWVLQHVNSEKTHVFLCSYGPAHFRGGSWKTGGQCQKETLPENSTWFQREPTSNQIMSEAIKQLNGKKNVQLLNITYLTEFRKDSHSSLYYLENGHGPAPIQDCSHWCLPGVPDTWNHLLYGYLVASECATDRRTWVSKG